MTNRSCCSGLLTKLTSLKHSPEVTGHVVSSSDACQAEEQRQEYPLIVLHNSLHRTRILRLLRQRLRSYVENSAHVFVEKRHDAVRVTLASALAHFPIKQNSVSAARTLPWAIN